MNIKLVNELYNEVLKKKSGSEIVKFDLHIHSPASKDFVSSDSYKGDSAYIKILEEAIDNGIRIIAITDHNTFKGYNEVYRILEIEDNKHIKNDLLILCGIEITCFSKHLLAIFPEGFSKTEQEKFLDEIGITKEQQGEEDAIADIYGPSLLMERISKYGGLSILAHADTKKGFLSSWCASGKDYDIDFSGTSLAKIIRSEYLNGIQINSENNKKIIIDKFKNPTYLGIEKYNEIPFLRFSDSHGYIIDGEYNGKSGQAIGEIFSLAKLSSYTFESLKMVLEDSEVRVLDKTIKCTYPQILGCAINSRVFRNEYKEYSLFRFNSEMNCVIGARGTGKSTLLEIIKDILIQTEPEESENNIRNRYIEAVIFLEKNDAVYAISKFIKINRKQYINQNEYLSTIQVYQLNNKQFILAKQANEDFKYFLTKGYRQGKLDRYENKEILELVDDFLKWRQPRDYTGIVKRIAYQAGEIEDAIKIYEKSYKRESLITYLEGRNLLKKIIKHYELRSKAYAELHKLRRDMISELNQLMIGKLKIKLSKRISKNNYSILTEVLPEAIRKSAGKYAEYRVSLSSEMKKLCDSSKIKDSFDFFILVLEKKYDEIIDKQKLNISKEALSIIREQISFDYLNICLEDDIIIKYNVNLGIKNSKEYYKEKAELSMGQNAVALLLLILSAAYKLGDGRPLIMDQPEDDLDNSYIYSTLVKEFRESKRKRQVIISTHNPNIPVSADAENILVLKYDGTEGYLFESGSIDKKEIALEVMNTLEGGKDAINNRFKKYKSGNAT